MTADEMMHTNISITVLPEEKVALISTEDTQLETYKCDSKEDLIIALAEFITKYPVDY